MDILACVACLLAVMTGLGLASAVMGIAIARFFIRWLDIDASKYDRDDHELFFYDRSRSRQ